MIDGLHEARLCRIEITMYVLNLQDARRKRRVDRVARAVRKERTWNGPDARLARRQKGGQTVRLGYKYSNMMDINREYTEVL